VFVLVQDTTEAGTSVDVQTGQSIGAGDRVGQGILHPRVNHKIAGAGSPRRPLGARVAPRQDEDAAAGVFRDGQNAYAGADGPDGLGEVSGQQLTGARASGIDQASTVSYQNDTG
jgi:hypothetical protein